MTDTLTDRLAEALAEYDAAKAQPQQLTPLADHKECDARIRESQAAGNGLYMAIFRALEKYIDPATRELEWDVLPSTISSIADRAFAQAVTLRPITDEDARKCFDACWIDHNTVAGMRAVLEALLPHGIPEVKP